jgi:hypothetical protein
MRQTDPINPGSMTLKSDYPDAVIQPLCKSTIGVFLGLFDGRHSLIMSLARCVLLN